MPDAQLLERYVEERDELAFKALVERHGPMVFAVCRGILRDANDAEDAFQATFLLLVRKAHALWVGESVGGWLHRVACRLALQMKADAGRRRGHERRAAERVNAASANGAPWDDANLVIHQEIDRLPERYRKPIVLCYLEGMTYEHAARHLGWTAGATQGRLTRARRLLHSRLTRRGVTVAGASLGTLAAPPGASAVSMAMLHFTIQSARHVTLTEIAATSTTSTAVTSLVSGALRTMLITKIVKVAAAAAILGVAAAGVANGLAATTRENAESTSGALFFAEGPTADSPIPVPVAGSGPFEAKAGTDHDDPFARPPGAAPKRMGAGDSFAQSSEINQQALNISGDLLPSGRLNRGDSVFSNLGGFRMHMRQDGNLVLYVVDDRAVPGNTDAVLSHSAVASKFYRAEVWSTGTNLASETAGPGSYCIMREDGNFVIYDENGRSCFETSTQGCPGAFLRCQNDGNVVIYTPDLIPVWHSGTYARPVQAIVRDPRTLLPLPR